jgi:hypothetical protein
LPEPLQLRAVRLEVSSSGFASVATDPSTSRTRARALPSSSRLERAAGRALAIARVDLGAAETRRRRRDVGRGDLAARRVELGASSRGLEARTFGLEAGRFGDEIFDGIRAELSLEQSSAELEHVRGERRAIGAHERAPGQVAIARQ